MAHANRQQGEEAGVGTDGQVATVREGRHGATGESAGDDDERERRQPPAAEGELEKEEDENRGGDSQCKSAVLNDQASFVVDHLDAVLLRELDPVERTLDVVLHTCTTGVGRDVDVAGDLIAVDDRKVGRDTDIGYVCQTNLAAVGCVNRKVLDGGARWSAFQECSRPRHRRPFAARRGYRR